MQKENSVLKTIWLKVPLFIRAVITGAFVSTFGVSMWVIFSITIPAPWSIAVMAAFLWVFWKYFSGSWYPKSTKQFRKENFRRTKLSSYEWKWGIIAAIIFVVLLHSGLAFTFRLMEYPADLFKLRIYIY